MKIWEQVSRPPERALKTIRGGRLAGMTDINPQWRYEIMTEVFGPCGIGWKYTIEEMWPVHFESGECTAFVRINLYISKGERSHGIVWSDPIPGIGGSMLVAQEKSGLRVSDEAYKMATTDALSVAMKSLGVAADIYAGLWDGAKYVDPTPTVKIDQKIQKEFIKQVTDCLLSVPIDEHYLQELWSEWDVEEKSFLWGKFNSQQRSQMKELMKGA